MNMRWRKMLPAFIIVLLIAAWGAPAYAAAPNDITLYTPYTDISVTPGQSINYSLQVSNHSNSIQNVNVGVQGTPPGWQVSMQSGGWDVRQIAVKPNDTQNLSLTVKVPLKVDKGVYHMTVNAPNANQIPLTVRVTKQGLYQSKMSTDQPNMEGHSDSTFTYSLNLKNGTSKDQLYSLTSKAPVGWSVDFKHSGTSVTSVKVKAGQSSSVDVNVNPPASGVKKGTYPITASASAGGTTSQVKLEAVVTGTYKVNLTTPSGRLSSHVTAGGQKTVTLQVTNKGSAPLSDLSLNANAPNNWNVDFKPNTIHVLNAGKSTTVQATIHADKKAIAGDYVTSMSVSNSQVNSSADFRVSVKTSALWGWIGVIFILLVIGVIYYLFRKYGRR